MDPTLAFYFGTVIGLIIGFFLAALMSIAAGDEEQQRLDDEAQLAFLRKQAD